MQNVEQTIISQYGNSPVLNQLIQNMNAYLDPTADLDAFYDNIWDIETAVGYGLDVWGAIVGEGRQLLVPNTEYFGFSQASLQPFGQEPFYSGPTTGTYLLSDTAYRLLILVKALSNISDASVPSYNRLLQNLFAGRGRCYVVDLGNMQMQYTFEFYLQPFEQAILTQSGAFPRPCGVKAYALQTPLDATLGFSEASLPGGISYQTFGHGVFSPGPRSISN
jgi:hypothetical protein